MKRPLSIAQILAWAQSYREATGAWPTVLSGDLAEARFETWQGIDKALRAGTRGLPGGSSLAQLLAEHYGSRNRRCPPVLTVNQILAWADEYHKQVGQWPTKSSGRPWTTSIMGKSR